MEIQIGNNIKTLRRQHGMTQEELALRLNVTAAAVSKWENLDSYPDISTLIPLAEVFGVTLDSLMGYDIEREEAEVANILDEYNRLTVTGRFQEASELISKAYSERPNNFRLIRAHMKNLAKSGGTAQHADELKRLADCILDGCQDEQTRLDALFVKAQIEYAEGRQDAALTIVDGFPDRAQNNLVKTAQLLQKSPEKSLYERRAAVGLAEIAAMYNVMSIISDEKIPLAERIKRCEKLGDGFGDLRDETGEIFPAMLAWMTYSHLNLRLTKSGADNDIITRLTDKELTAAKALDMLNAEPIKTVNGSKVAERLREHYETAEHPEYAHLRSDPEYLNVLKKHADQSK